MSTYRPSYYALAWDALRIFREEMRRFVVENLQAKFGDLWMAQGVERHFKLEQIDDLRRILGQRARAGQVVTTSAESIEDMLDLSHFRQIIEGNWNQVFRDALGDKAVLDQWIAEATAARNPLAHWAGGDMPRKDALRVIDTCERVVRSISPERADELLALWNTVDAMGRDETPEGQRATVVFRDRDKPVRATIIFDQPRPASKGVPAYIAKARESYPRAYERWTPEEEQQILGLAESGYRVAAIAEVTGRQPAAVRGRLIRLGLTEAGGEQLADMRFERPRSS